MKKKVKIKLTKAVQGGPLSGVGVKKTTKIISEDKPKPSTDDGKD